MIAAIYARKSTDQNGVADDQKSVARQIEHARAYAAAKGWSVADEHVYVDDGISGAEFSNRPGFLRLMNALKPRPPFQVLVMSEESRLGREQIETSYALKQLVQAGVRVFFYLEDRERTLDSPTDKIMLSLAAFADELEREKGRQRTKDAMTRKARAGHLVGGDCFAYRNREVLGPDGTRSHVVREVVPEQATVVQRIFDLCAAGYGKARIAKMLNEERAPAPRPRQGRPAAWAPSSVQAVLGRESYRGSLVWNKSAKRDSWGRAKRQRRPESEWLRVEAPELRIVTDEQWRAAHERLAATRANYLRTTNGKLWGRPPVGTASKYLLTGLARCSHCGAGLEMRSRATSGGRRLYFYSCSSFYRRGRAICPNKIEIPMKRADAAVIEALLGELLTAERLAHVAQRAVDLARAEREAQPDLRARLERDLAAADVALARLTDAVAGGGGEVPALVERLKAQDAERRAIAARLAALAVPLPAAVGADVEERLRAAVEQWRSVLGRQVPLARQIVTKLLAEKLVFAPEPRDGRAGFRFSGTGTVEKLIAGAVPASFLAVVPSTGFEPVSPP